MSEDKDAEEIISKYKSEAEAARAEAKDFEDKMMKAALYGRDLLEKNLELESQLEKEKQEKHEAQLRFQTKSDLERSLTAELESLRESLKYEEQKVEQLKEAEIEKSTKREEELNCRLTETEKELEAAMNRESSLKTLVETLEKQLQESNSELNKSAHGESFSDEIEKIQTEKIELLQEKQSIELELTQCRQLLTSSQNQVSSLRSELEEKQNEIESVQSEVGSYSKTIESLNRELVEVQGLLDAERNIGASVGQSDKGNSLFSEVEDRRQVVEDQLSAVNTKYNAIKENYDVKVAELQKVKMHNSQLLSIAGGRNDTDHVSRLEEMLTKEKNKVRDLMDKLEEVSARSISRSPPSSTSAPPPQPPPEAKNDVSAMDTDESTSTVQQSDILQSTEYKYMVHMLEVANTKKEEAKEENRRLVREGVEQSDKQQQLSRQLHNVEHQMKKLQAENYSLKIQLEENKNKVVSAGNEKRDVRKRRIVEQVNFSNDDVPKENNIPTTSSSDFCIKESVVTKSAKTEDCGSSTKPVLDELSCTRNKGEDKPVVPETKKRRGIILSDKVEEFSEDGSKQERTIEDIAASKTLDTAGKSDGLKRTKPGKKHTSNDAKRAEVNPECKQQ